MALSAIHEKLEDIPEQYQELYTEKNGKFELTGIAGVKSQADIDRLQGALTKERDDHKTTREKAGVWGDLDHSEVVAQLDRLPELEAAAKGKLDDAAIEDIVSKRVDGTIASKLAPIERDNKNLKKANDELLTSNTNLVGEKRTRAIHDDVRSALTKAKVIPEAQADALMLAERIFEVREDDGAIITKENSGVTPGVNAETWLQDVQTTRPHWWAPSQGGGARPGLGLGGGFANNPWSDENWNMTKQGQIMREQGAEKAGQMAKAAGTSVGGKRPAAKAAA